MDRKNQFLAHYIIEVCDLRFDKIVEISALPALNDRHFYLIGNLKFFPTKIIEKPLKAGKLTYSAYEVHWNLKDSLFQKGSPMFNTAVKDLKNFGFNEMVA